MRELGDQAENAHLQVAQHAVAVGAKYLMFTGPYAGIAAAQAEGHGAIEVTVAADASDLTKRIDDLPRPAFILVKGSRGARVERLIDAMRERS
jgi:UDP-N-acetylmuramyl pentapeptide synthase